MRLIVAGLVLATATACAGSSSDQRLGGGPPGDVRQSPVIAPPFLKVTTAPLPAASPSSPVASPKPSSVVAAGTATSGPGRVSISSPPPSPSRRPTPTAVGGTVTVTDDDSGSTVHLTVGQHLRVRLSSGTWDPPVSSADGVVVRRTTSGGYPSGQAVDATFDAVGHGSADVTAQSDAACFHTEPRCMMASRQWQVHVIVS
ncbi:MAG: Secreted cellulose-binding, family bacterial type [Frankiales bacterium]|jgi:FlaG/FlaF family flagellin (archaellin)|nr:Secreted cellulose-binding, family bacterial type [Frankiales bacterium]